MVRSRRSRRRPTTSGSRRATPRGRSGAASAGRSTRRRGRARTPSGARRRCRRTVWPPGGRRAPSAAPRGLRTTGRPGSDPDASIGVLPSSRVRSVPTASNCSSAKPSGSICAWHVAHAGFCRCASSRSRTDCRWPSAPLSLSAGTSGGGGGGGVPRMFSSSHLPRRTGDVRFGYEVIVSTLPWASRPPRSVPVMATRRKRLPETPGTP